MNENPHSPPNDFMDLLLDAVCMVDRDGYFRYVSAASERIFGYLPEEMVDRSVMDFVHPGDRQRTLQAIYDILEGELKPYFENRYVRKDGKIAHIMWSAHWSESQQLRVAVARDVTERRHAELMQAALYAIAEAAIAPGDLQTLFQRIHDVVNDLLLGTNFAVALYDPEKDELSFPYHADQYRAAPAPHRLKSDILLSQVILTGQALLLTPDSAASVLSQLNVMASPVALNWLGVPLESAGQVLGALVVQSYTDDVCFTEEDRELLQFIAAQLAAAIERKRLHSRLEHMAQHDQLTDLPNRTLFLDHLHKALPRAQREQTRLAVLYLDLDHFKQVNDTHGHTAGDHLLQEVAHRLLRCVRKSDTVGRLGGDEFIILLDGIKQPADADMVAEKILASLSAPYAQDSLSLQIIPSIGVAIFPDNGENGDQLIRYADDAMYQEKRNHRQHIKEARSI